MSEHSSIGDAIEAEGVEPTLDQEQWNEPQPLYETLESLPYPSEALPHGIREAVEEVQRYMQCPMAIAAAGALATLSVTGQGLANVHRDSALCSPCTLYFLTVAESGERKSAVDDLFSRPLIAWEDEQRRLLDPEVKKRNAEISAWECTNEGIESAIKAAAKQGTATDQLKAKLIAHGKLRPTPLKSPNTLFRDATIEKIVVSLAERWPSAGWMSSEGGAILGGYSFRGDALLGTLATLNERWDGRPLRRDRQVAQSARCERPRLTVAISLQGSALAAFEGNGNGLARGTGFWARFLMAQPDTTQGTRVYREPGSLARLAAFHRRITELLADVQLLDDGELSLNPVQFCSEGKILWVRAYNEIEERLRPHGELSDVRDAASKAADNIARLSALFSLYSGGSATLMVDPAHVDPAARIVMWHLREAQRIIGTAGADPETVAATQVEAWLIAHLRKEGITSVNSREVLQRIVPVRLRKAAELDRALKTLVAHDRARVMARGRSKLIAVNPDVLSTVSST